MKKRLVVMATFLAVGLMTVCGWTQEKTSPHWYRGMIHMHSYWSDGQAFPEESLSLYKQAGYDFLCPSDHNKFQDQNDYWAEVGNKIKPESLQRFEKKFGSEGLEKKTVTEEKKVKEKAEDGSEVEKTVTVEKTLIRLKNFDELKKFMEKDGNFVLIPGYEHSGGSQNGEQVHINAVGTRCVVPLLRPATSEEMLQQNVEVLDKMLADEKTELGKETLAFTMLNHPDWRWYDVSPEELVGYPSIRFFEICNCGPSWPTVDGCWSCDQFWDVVNAYRAEKNLPLLYGVASDDTHNYDNFYKDVTTAPGGWIMVKAPELTQEAILTAMHEGDFYASTGVTLDDVLWDADTKTLTVNVTPRQNEKLTVSFITTPEGFDHTTAQMNLPKEGDRPARCVTTWSDEIGQTCATSTVEHAGDGTPGMSEVKCTLPANSLYLRAKIESDQPMPLPRKGKPEHQTAWTQAYR
ncbi:MAG: hypothetical protein PHE53_04025 [Thermoguttaceae bacterium]|nr:hypothetical protein [Thermoguttaceae bacterium]